MNAPSQVRSKELRGAILRDVSRSFYLSIRFLPTQLRDPIALAYLLARATDTIADTTEIEPALRLARLHDLAALIQRDDLASKAADSFESFASLQKNDAERALIERLPGCLAWLQALPAEDRADIREVLGKINEGQVLDVERFQNAAEIIALETAADLDRYTYLVAGSVGEFWTNTCFRRLPTFTSQPGDEMRRAGVEFGKGLQLVNILRDIGADLRNGRCYLPAEELRAIGVAPSDLKNEPARAEPIVHAWLERAEQGMAAGAEYACAIQPWRVRLATVLPALIGMRTIRLLRAAGNDVFRARVKVPRAEVRRILMTLIARSGSPAAIRELFAKLS